MLTWPLGPLERNKSETAVRLQGLHIFRNHANMHACMLYIGYTHTYIYIYMYTHTCISIYYIYTYRDIQLHAARMQAVVDICQAQGQELRVVAELLLAVTDWRDQQHLV